MDFQENHHCNTNRLTNVCFESSQTFIAICRERIGQESRTFEIVESEIIRYYESSTTDPMRLIDLCWYYIQNDANIDNSLKEYLGLKLNEMLK